MVGRSRRNGGYSFLELVVVLSILAIVTAIIVPLYGPSVSALQRRSARGDFLATLYYLQELSIRESRELHLCIDPREGSYWAEKWDSGLGDEAVFVPLDDRQLGTPRTFPKGVEISRINAPKNATGTAHCIRFYPNGACDPASLRFGRSTDPDDFYTVELTGVLGEIVVGP